MKRGAVYTRLLTVGVLVCIVGGCSTATGKVTDALTGGPVVGATITLGTARATAGADGTFAVSGLSKGSYTLAVVKPGYASRARAIRVADGGNDIGELVMVPDVEVVDYPDYDAHAAMVFDQLQKATAAYAALAALQDLPASRAAALEFSARLDELQQRLVAAAAIVQALNAFDDQFGSLAPAAAQREKAVLGLVEMVTGLLGMGNAGQAINDEAHAAASCTTIPQDFDDWAAERGYDRPSHLCEIGGDADITYITIAKIHRDFQFVNPESALHTQVIEPGAKIVIGSYTGEATNLIGEGIGDLGADSFGWLIANFNAAVSLTTTAYHLLIDTADPEAPTIFIGVLQPSQQVPIPVGSYGGITTGGPDYARTAVSDVVVASQATTTTDFAPPATYAPWPMFRQSTTYHGASPYLGPVNPGASELVGMPTVGSIGTCPVLWSGGVLLREGTEGSSKIIEAIDIASNSRLWTYPSPGTAGYLTVGADGTIYFVSRTDYALTALTASGSFKWRYTAPDVGDRYSSGGIPAVGADGTIYYSTVGFPGYPSAVHAVTVDGQRKWKYTSSRRTNFRMQFLAIGADDTLYVAVGCVLVALRSDGNVAWEREGTCGFRERDIAVLALTRDGRVAVSSSYDISNVVYVISSDGTATLSAHASGNGPHAIRGDNVMIASRHMTQGAGPLIAESLVTGQVLWENSLINGAYSIVVDANGVAYVGTYVSPTETPVYAVSPAGEILWQRNDIYFPQCMAIGTERDLFVMNGSSTRRYKDQ